ncbi:MAG: glycosyltransferase family 2 protein [Pseudomonadota bacterium]
MTFTLVATAKNEAPFLLEWVAYHKMIGFDHIIIYQNDSNDMTDRMLRILREMGVVRYFHNPAPRGSYQVRAYKRATGLAEYVASDWAMALDLDEFLHIKCGQGRLEDLVREIPDADQICINWRLFGSSGRAELTEDLVTARFTTCDRPDHITRRLIGFKTLFRTARFGRPGVHKPAHPKKGALRKVNGSGLPEGSFATANWRSKDPDARRYAEVCHYAIRDAMSFVVKSVRGSAHQAHRSIDQAYWTQFDKYQYSEPSMAALAPRIWAEMEALDAASDHRLLALRTKAIQIHRQKFEAAMADDSVRALYAFCTGTTEVS